MISYAPFYETLKKKNFSTYKLINQFGVSRSLLDRLKHKSGSFNQLRFLLYTQQHLLLYSLKIDINHLL